MIQVYGLQRSRSLRITWLLEELQLDYQYHPVDFAKGENRSPEFLALNPSGKVPVIDDNGLVLTESAAIVSHLADKYGDRAMIPAPGTDARGLYEQWNRFAVCELEQPLWTIGKHKFALPRERRVAEVIPTAQWEFQQALQLLSDGLGEREFLLEQGFSALEPLVGQVLFWGQAFKQPIEQSNLQDYIQRLQQRPALQRAIEREQSAE